MDERQRRLWAGAEADAIGYGGLIAVHRATGLAISTVLKGRGEVRAGSRRDDVVNVRRSTGKRPFEELHPEVWPALEKLVDPVTRGDPESPLRWTCKSTPRLADELFAQFGIRISERTVAKLLRDHDYSLQAPNKSVEGAQHPDRDAQFEHINATAADRIRRGVPVISVDTEKKELVGNHKNGGREWQPAGEPMLVDVHDFPDEAVGKAIPYGVYDVAANAGFVSVGIDHDTPVFAVMTIAAWWKKVGSKRYPDARELFISADAGGSNGYRSHLWEFELPVLVHLDELARSAAGHVRDDRQPDREHDQPWRSGRARRLDRRRYPTGKKIPAKELRTLKIERHAFCGDWNYVIKPRTEKR